MSPAQSARDSFAVSPRLGLKSLILPLLDYAEKIQSEENPYLTITFALTGPLVTTYTPGASASLSTLTPERL